MAEYRAGMMKDILAAFSDLGPEREAKLRAGMSDASLDTVNRAARTSWLDAEIMIEMDWALVDVVGPQQFEEFWIEFASHASRVPIIRPLAAGAMRLLGTPRGVLKSLVVAYKYITRGLGAYTLEFTDEQDAVMRIDGIELSSVELFAIANRGSLIGAMTMVNTVAQVDSKFEQGPPGWLELRVRW